MVREGIAWHRATDSHSYLPGFLAGEGELMARAGDPEGGLARFEEAFQRMESLTLSVVIARCPTAICAHRAGRVAL